MAYINYISLIRKVMEKMKRVMIIYIKNIPMMNYSNFSLIMDLLYVKDVIHYNIFIVNVINKIKIRQNTKINFTKNI
jgi:hypothetical protein